MGRSRARLPGFALVLLLTAGCGGGAGMVRQAATPVATALDGQALYERECLACHMRDGRGVPGMNPPLLGSAWVSGGAEALAGFVLTGGFSSAVLMARFDYLSDAELAAILTYVRAAFGAQAGAVGVEDVARARAQFPQAADTGAAN